MESDKEYWLTSAVSTTFPFPPGFVTDSDVPVEFESTVASDKLEVIHEVTEALAGKPTNEKVSPIDIHS